MVGQGTSFVSAPQGQAIIILQRVLDVFAVQGSYPRTGSGTRFPHAMRQKEADCKCSTMYLHHHFRVDLSTRR